MSAKTDKIVELWDNGKGLKQKEIAEKLEVSEPYVSQILAPYKAVSNFNSNPIYLSSIPEEVLIAWDQVSESIESAWGKKRPDGTRKWGSKYAHFLIVKNWIDKQK
jgi:orotate phosphoribosyltransferase-like protein